MFANGDIVRLKKEFCNSEFERKFVYQVTNVNEKTKRCDITVANGNLALAPTEVVSFEMIEDI